MQGQVVSVVKVYMVMQFWHQLDTRGGPKTLSLKTYLCNYITGLF
jgi:hypothetical protein